MGAIQTIFTLVDLLAVEPDCRRESKHFFAAGGKAHVISRPPAGIAAGL
jgi:hypothetical protein